MFHEKNSANDSPVSLGFIKLDNAFQLIVAHMNFSFGSLSPQAPMRVVRKILKNQLYASCTSWQSTTIHSDVKADVNQIQSENRLNIGLEGRNI